MLLFTVALRTGWLVRTGAFISAFATRAATGWWPVVVLLLLTAGGAGGQALRGTFASGVGHSLSIHADGTLWATGSNYSGQLGTSGGPSTLTWVQVGTATNWVQVVAGDKYSLGLRADGTLWAWGDNGIGQLGIISYVPSITTPTLVSGGSTYIQIAAGRQHTLGLRADGTLWAWGDNYTGQLGDGTYNTYTSTPKLVSGGGTYTQIAAGNQHSLGLRADGTLWAWGWNGDGQLGNDDYGHNTNTPTLVSGGGTYTQIAAGNRHSLGLRADGTVWVWGNNAVSQSSIPVQVSGGGTYTQVAAGYAHCLALRADGTIWAWGYNGSQQLGTSGSGNGFVPALVNGGGTYTQITGGDQQSLGLRADGTLWAWGENREGQLGNGTASPISTPTATGTALPTRSTAAGGNFGMAVRPDGSLWAWGDNTYGQLGIGTTGGNRLRPVRVGTDNSWVMVAAGEVHTLGLKADGTVWAWGDNSFSQLGNGTTSVNANTPALVSGGGTYTRIAAGNHHSLGLKVDGTLSAWGYNGNGVLGNGTTSGNAITPTPVAGGNVYAQVAAGSEHSLALKADGRLYAWGYNQQGQLGIGTNTDVRIPTLVSGSGTYTKVAAGGGHSLGRRADGALWTWGNNAFGQLGLGTTTSTNTPAQVGGGGVYTQVAGGLYHSLGLRADGTLWTWGYNTYGQLGLGTTVDVLTPVQEATLVTGWTTLAPGPVAVSSLARIASGLVFASTGRNAYGQLGDGTTTQATRFDRISPLSSFQSLPVRGTASNSLADLALFPNPAHGTATLTGGQPSALVTVLDALGRLVASAPTDATGTAALALPAGLPAGVYVVRTGTQALRLTVE